MTAVKTKPKYVRPVSDGRALDSLRHSSFDFYHALCETVDNSLQANAKRIEIFISTESSGRVKRINEVVCLDNGDGMETDVLHNCLALGYGTRYGNRHGIGRFGVGMTLAAISQCKRIEVYSKCQNTILQGTHLDLDEFNDEDNPAEGIPEPKPFKKDCYGLEKLQSGTVVVWKKCDRIDLPHDIGSLEDEFHYAIGRIYRHWLIREKVEIFLNGKAIYFHDPLFEHKSLIFPDDPITSVPVTEATFSYPIPTHVVEGGLSGGKTHSEIKIRMSLLPEEFRLERHRGGKDFPKRYFERNQGVSILRANREVHFDHIKHYRPAFKESDRWWACEIYFDPVLDDCFKILNIKLGVRVEKDLRELIQKKIEPTRQRFLEEISTFWDKSESKRAENGDGPHASAEKAAEKAKYKPKVAKKKSKDDIANEERRILETLAKDLSEKERTVLLERIKSFRFTIEEQPWPGDLFLDMKPAGDNMVLIYNTRYHFFQTLYEPIRKIREDSKYGDDAKQLAAVVDLLLISFCGAKRNFDDNETHTTERFFNDLLRDWGQILHNFIKELR